MTPFRRAFLAIAACSLTVLALLALACGGNGSDNAAGDGATPPPAGFTGPSCGEGSGSRLDSVERRIQPGASSSDRQFPNGPQEVIDPQRTYVAHMATSRGDIVIELTAAQTPITVNSFVFLACSGYYDGLSFHRVVNNPQGGLQIVQGGDPRGDGTGGPGYRFADEIVADLRHTSGVLSMANAGPGTNGSQFFLTFGPAPHLDGRHTVFGRITAGLDVVRAIRQGDRIDRIDIEER